jgi:pimeloyl-ACP methyl ester carboxylesterase
MTGARRIVVRGTGGWARALLGAVCVVVAAAGAGGQEAPAAASPPSAQRIQAPPWAPEIPFTPLAHVEVFGSGPIPMVLIPGIAQDWTVFKTFMERNARRYTMYAVTLPGFGDSPAPPFPDNAHFKDLPVLHNALKAIQFMIAERGIDRPVIGGYELGGHLALWLALEHPESFRAVIGIEGYPFVPLSPGALEFNEDARIEHIRTKVVHPMNSETEQAWRARMKKLALTLVSDPERGAEVGEMITTPTRGVTMEHTLEYFMSDLRVGLGKLEVPLLVIAAMRPESWFRADIARDQWRSLYATASCTTLVFFNKCKPYVLDEAPDELDVAVEEFLSGKPVSGGLVSSKGSCIPEHGVGAAGQ